MAWVAIPPLGVLYRRSLFIMEFATFSMLQRARWEEGGVEAASSFIPGENSYDRKLSFVLCVNIDHVRHIAKCRGGLHPVLRAAPCRGEARLHL